MTPISGDVFALYVFAVWRLSYMLVYEDGAFGIADRLRALSNHVGLGGLFSCVWCVSVWLSGLMLLTHALAPSAAYIVALWLGLSACAIMVHVGIEYLRGNDENDSIEEYPG